MSEWFDDPLQFDDAVKDAYFTFLCDLIDYDIREQEYGRFLYILHDKEFYSVVPQDVNREADARALRERFADLHEADFGNFESIEGPCSLLEILVALAERIDYILADVDGGDGRPGEWFDMMVKNWIGFEPCENLALTPSVYIRMRNAMDNLVERTYDYDGNGGLFPLLHPDQDQRGVELWYQMQAYLDEKFTIL